MNFFINIEGKKKFGICINIYSYNFDHLSILEKKLFGIFIKPLTPKFLLSSKITLMSEIENKVEFYILKDQILYDRI